MRGVKNSLQIFLIALFIGVSFTSMAVELPKSIQKKIDKEMKKVFSLEEFNLCEMENLNFDTLSCEAIKNVRVSSVKCTDQLKGFACFASSKGKNDFFDYMVVFNKQLEIQKVVVLMYRSSYGGEITARSWLKQFIGKVSGEEMEFGRDIDGISGATLSAPSISEGIKTVSILMSQLRVKGDI